VEALNLRSRGLLLLLSVRPAQSPVLMPRSSVALTQTRFLRRPRGGAALDRGGRVDRDHRRIAEHLCRADRSRQFRERHDAHHHSLHRAHGLHNLTDGVWHAHRRCSRRRPRRRGVRRGEIAARTTFAAARPRHAGGFSGRLLGCRPTPVQDRCQHAEGRSAALRMLAVGSSYS
jgi:hypothetical protein